MKMIDLPRVTLNQPDGTTVDLDFSARGAYGDFAFSAQFEDGRRRIFGVHHLEEPAMYVTFLSLWLRLATPEAILEDLQQLKIAVSLATAHTEPTFEGENSFAPYGRQIETLADSRSRMTRRFRRAKGRTLTVAPHGTRLRLTNAGLDIASVDVEPTDLWKVAAGFLWRTYKHDVVPLSRLCTADYEDVLRVFESAVRRAAEAD